MAETVWQPREFVRFEAHFKSSTCPALIVTDAGRAYLKAINNPLGPDALAREWVGSLLARWLGLETPDFAVMMVTDDDEIPLAHRTRAAPGPAFVSRAIKGHPWGGEPKELTALQNPQSITWLVAFDTWTLNGDRHHPDPQARKPRPDNVFFAEESAEEGKLRLVALDHSECFGGTGRDIGRHLAVIERVRDALTYGLFPAFRRYVTESGLKAVAARLQAVNSELVTPMVESLPGAWNVTERNRVALCELIVRRAQHLSDCLEKQVMEACGKLAL